VPRPCQPCESTTSRTHTDPWPLPRHPENSGGLPGPYKLRGLTTLKKRQNHGKSDTHKRNTNTGNTTETREVFFFPHFGRLSRPLRLLRGCRGFVARPSDVAETFNFNQQQPEQKASLCYPLPHRRRQTHPVRCRLTFLPNAVAYDKK